MAAEAPESAFDAFLDRLMHAESGGRSHAKNPRSSALGPFQFINSTFLSVMRRHFPADVANMSDRQILALRTDHDFARRAAEAFCRENLDYLADRGINATFGHLRLAFLLGPEGAARVLQAPSTKPVANVLNGGVISANPFMRRMSVADLVARATRDVNPKEPSREPLQVAQATQLPKPDAATADVPAPAAQPVETEAAAPQPTRVAAAEPEPQAEQLAPATVTEAAPATEPAPATAEAAPEPKARPAERPAVASSSNGSVHTSGGRLVINVKCDSRRASCQRWVDQQVANLLRVSDRG